MELLLEKSLEVRPVTLSSGKASNFYMDCKRVTLSPEGAYLTAKLMMDMIGPDVSAVGGLTLGADPIVSSISVLSHIQGRGLAGLIVRKEPKKHGTMNYVEGPALESRSQGCRGGGCGYLGSLSSQSHRSYRGRWLPACTSPHHSGSPGRRQRCDRVAGIRAAGALHSR